jgi:hypothetical protein
MAEESIAHPSVPPKTTGSPDQHDQAGGFQAKDPSHGGECRDDQKAIDPGQQVCGSRISDREDIRDPSAGQGPTRRRVISVVLPCPSPKVVRPLLNEESNVVSEGLPSLSSKSQGAVLPCFFDGFVGLEFH